MTSVIEYRDQQLRTLTRDFGVYALCDLDEIPIYVGQSFGGAEGIRARVRRHLTSARSDVIANRLVDVWEVAFVWGWPCASKPETDAVEATLLNDFGASSPLMNGVTLPAPLPRPITPERQRVQILEDSVIARRKLRENRFPRQLLQVSALVDYLLEVKDEPHIRLALAAHFTRLLRYYEEFRVALPQIPSTET